MEKLGLCSRRINKKTYQIIKTIIQDLTSGLRRVIQNVFILGEGCFSRIVELSASLIMIRKTICVMQLFRSFVISEDHSVKECTIAHLIWQTFNFSKKEFKKIMTDGREIGSIWRTNTFIGITMICHELFLALGMIVSTGKNSSKMLATLMYLQKEDSYLSLNGEEKEWAIWVIQNRKEFWDACATAFLLRNPKGLRVHRRTPF